MSWLAWILLSMAALVLAWLTAAALRGAARALAHAAGAVAVLGALLVSSVGAEVRLPAVFTDHAVLQRDRPLPVWGWATPGATVTVQLAADRATAIAGADSAWSLTLPARAAGGPYRLVVRGDGPEVVVDDVLVGEVWLASGQSNMQFALVRADNGEAAIAAADLPRLRLLSVPRETAATPQSDVDAAWAVCTPASAPGFSAVAFYFGRRLQAELDVPVGLIHSSWGGTRIEPWTDLASLHALAPRLSETQRAALEAGLARAETGPPAEDPEAQRERQVLRQARDASIARLQAAEADSVDPGWARPEADDGDWPTMMLPVQWEQAGLTGFDGMVWFRRTVDIPAAWAGRDLVLRLGPVDEVDVTWFDGVRVGATGSYSGGVYDYWDDARRYVIPGRLVRPGPRVLALRVIDSALAGGVWGSEPGDLSLAPADAAGQGLPLAGAWRFQAGVQLAPAPPAPPAGQAIPAALYHAMIHPLVPYALRGAIWYQGEANLRDGAAYTAKMATLIDAWRRAWGQPLAFDFVQLAPFRYGDPTLLPQIWEAQADVLDRVEDTGMAVVNDVGDVDDIHPTDKETVGERLARWALGRTYGRALEVSGPRYASMEVDGGRVRLRFTHAEGLRSADGEPLTWFEVAGADSAFVAADASVDGTDVWVSSPEVKRPRFVRFAWHEEAEPNLVNGDGLPASAFRTHRW